MAPKQSPTQIQTTGQNGISVVVPTLNEAGCMRELLERIDQALGRRSYEVIVIDDHSTDNTVEIVEFLRDTYPVRAHLKQGARGKAVSLLEGFALARYDTVAMIDADLQYPPEALAGMARMIEQDEADVVIAERHPQKTHRLRTLLSKVFRLFFGRLLWKLDVDTQSGLKVFKKEILERAQLQPQAAWAFDLDFLVRARNGGYRLGKYDIEFIERSKGTTKVKWLSTSWQLGWSALKLRLKSPQFIPFHPRQVAVHGQGFHYRGQPYVTHTSLTREDTAMERTFVAQRLVLALMLAGLVAAFVADWFASLVITVTVMTALYFFDLLFSLYLVLRSYYKSCEVRISDGRLAAIKTWPRYTVLCPLYKESSVLPQFTRAMQQLDYPKHRLEVLLLFEEDDTETINKARLMHLPKYFKILVVPHALPKTKPKACNYGLLQATGEYAVIYDAEDIPDPLQLKKAAVAFADSAPIIGCIQAKLNYYNWDQNLLTRLFTLEYSLWFNLVLCGLQSISAPIPLGGTSNHFRVRDLRDFAGWDPFNVTEDADLGMRLAKRGFQTAILDSYTLEEANSQFTNWLKQRSRWIKGYMQTYLVHMRRPRSAFAQKRSHLLFMQMILGGKVLSMLINPLLWAATLTYSLVAPAREFISSLYLGPTFYMGLFSLVVGNFLYMYYYMMGASEQKRPELIPYALLVPGYWLMMSLAAAYAFRDLLIRPHHWHKTKHGLHLTQPPQTPEPALGAA